MCGKRSDRNRQSTADSAILRVFQTSSMNGSQRSRPEFSRSCLRRVRGYCVHRARAFPRKAFGEVRCPHLSACSYSGALPSKAASFLRLILDALHQDLSETSQPLPLPLPVSATAQSGSEAGPFSIIQAFFGVQQDVRSVCTANLHVTQQKPEVYMVDLEYASLIKGGPSSNEVPAPESGSFKAGKAGLSVAEDSQRKRSSDDFSLSQTATLENHRRNEEESAEALTGFCAVVQSALKKSTVKKAYCWRCAKRVECLTTTQVRGGFFPASPWGFTSWRFRGGFLKPERMVAVCCSCRCSRCQCICA